MLLHLGDGFGQGQLGFAVEGRRVAEVIARDGCGAEGSADAGHGVDTDHLAAAAAQVDLAEILGGSEGLFLALDAQIVAFAVAGIVVVFGGVHATDHHIDRGGDVARRKAEIGSADAIDHQLVLRQLQVQIQVHVAQPGLGQQAPLQFLGHPTYLFEVGSAHHELEGFPSGAAQVGHRDGEGADAGNGGEFGG